MACMGYMDARSGAWNSSYVGIYAPMILSGKEFITLLTIVGVLGIRALIVQWQPPNKSTVDRCFANILIFYFYSDTS